MDNPIKFPVGTYIRSGYSGFTYLVCKHTKQGMTTLLNTTLSTDSYTRIETWNSHNNAHFVPAYFIGVEILVSLL